MQEIIFWIIFIGVAIALLVTQYLVQVPRQPVQPEVKKLETVLPDAAKKDPNAKLIYENSVILEKLGSVLEKREIVFALGTAAGPNFKAQFVRESARQNAFQEIIGKLEGKKSNMESRLPKEAKPKVDELFQTIFNFITVEDGAMINTVRIWESAKGDIVTYHFLMAFDEEYTLAFIRQRVPELVEELEKSGSVDFAELWLGLFALAPKGK